MQIDFISKVKKLELQRIQLLDQKQSIDEQKSSRRSPGNIESIATARVPNRSHIQPMTNINTIIQQSTEISQEESRQCTHRSSVVFDEQTRSAEFHAQTPLPFTRMSLPPTFELQAKKFVPIPVEQIQDLKKVDDSARGKVVTPSMLMKQRAQSDAHQFSSIFSPSDTFYQSQRLMPMVQPLNHRMSHQENYP